MNTAWRSIADISTLCCWCMAQCWRATEIVGLDNDGRPTDWRNLACYRCRGWVQVSPKIRSRKDCQTHTRMIVVIGVRHTGQPAASSATLLAQDSQKRACPHGTNASPCRGSTRHTSQQSSAAAAAAGADAEVGAADAADRNATQQSFRFLTRACFIVLTLTVPYVQSCNFSAPDLAVSSFLQLAVGK